MWTLLKKTGRRDEARSLFTARFVRRLVKLAQRSGPVGANIREALPPSMLSDGEIFFLDLLLSAADRPVRIAELGCYLGGTTGLFARAAPKGTKIEVYDLFEHNGASARRLKADPLFDPKSFFEIWRRNTAPYADAIVLARGDLRETASLRSEPLDILYVDIVKHRSLVNLMPRFYDRLATGGILLHQDYFHWQSPWLVYQMEHLLAEGRFELLGDVGFNMTVYRKSGPCPAHPDYLDGISAERKLALFDAAIARYGHSKSGMLAVSRLRLVQEIGGADQARLAAEIAEAYEHSPRVLRYLRACVDSAGQDNVW